MTKKVLMHFDREGNAKVEAQGYEGGTCIDATQPFEQIFGKEVGEREMVGECAGGASDMGERVR